MDTRKFTRHTPGVLPGQPNAAQPQDLPQIGRVARVDATGARFELASAPGHTYGPAPWSLGPYVSVAAAITAGSYPHVGDFVLVVFAGAGIGRPVVVAWWR